MQVAISPIKSKYIIPHEVRRRSRVFPPSHECGFEEQACEKPQDHHDHQVAYSWLFDVLNDVGEWDLTIHSNEQINYDGHLNQHHGQQCEAHRGVSECFHFK